MTFKPAEGYIVCQPAHRQFGRYAVCKVEDVSGYSTIPAKADVVLPPTMYEELEGGLWLISSKAVIGWFASPAEMSRVS